MYSISPSPITNSILSTRATLSPLLIRAKEFKMSSCKTKKMSHRKDIFEDILCIESQKKTICFFYLCVWNTQDGNHEVLELVISNLLVCVTILTQNFLDFSTRFLLSETVQACLQFLTVNLATLVTVKLTEVVLNFLMWREVEEVSKRQRGREGGRGRMRGSREERRETVFVYFVCGCCLVPTLNCSAVTPLILWCSISSSNIFCFFLKKAWYCSHCTSTSLLVSVVYLYCDSGREKEEQEENE